MRTPTEFSIPFDAFAKQQISERRFDSHKDLRNFFDLSQEAFDKLIGVAKEGAIKDLRSIKESLEAQIEQEEIDRWLHAPNPMFDGKTPVQAMIEGKTDRILDILIRLEEGIHN